jgi:hypothetical protein
LMKLVYFKIGRWESILSPLPSFWKNKRLIKSPCCLCIPPESESESESHCDWRSVSLSDLVSSPVRGSWPDISYCLTISVLSLGGRPLWRKGGSVSCQSLSAVLSQLCVYPSWKLISLYNFRSDCRENTASSSSSDSLLSLCVHYC